jgi:hypothetical protein
MHRLDSKTVMTENQNIDAAAGDGALLDLGVALGQTHAFGLIAGRCSAAQAEAIRRLRDQRLYKRVSETWDDFCRSYLRISKPEADRTIRLLEEFGPVYFDVSQLTRISPETYRAIAPAIQDGKLHFNGEEIPLSPEHSRKVAAAVAEMRSAIPKRTTNPEVQRLMRELNDSQHDLHLGGTDRQAARMLHGHRQRARTDFFRRAPLRQPDDLQQCRRSSLRRVWPARADTRPD